MWNARLCTRAYRVRFDCKTLPFCSMESHSDELMSHPDYAMPWRIATPLTHFSVVNRELEKNAKLYAVLPIARLCCNNPVALRFLSSFALHVPYLQPDHSSAC